MQMMITDARRIARKLMTEHGLMEQGWTYGFDKSVRRFGACDYKLKRITLSRKLVELNDEARVRNTILHEIAHALTSKYERGHGPTWKNMALTIGCDGEPYYDTMAVNAVKKTAKGVCPNCRRVIMRHRRTKIACGVCCRKYNHNKFDTKYLFEWEKL